MIAPAATMPAPVSDALGILQRHGDNPSAFLALNRDTRHFRLPGRDGLVAYRPAGRRHLVQVGGVFAAAQDRGPILDAFLATAARHRRRVVAVQLLRDDVDVYRQRGFRIDQFGSSYSLDLRRYSLAGKRFMRLRNKISRARRAGVDVAEVGVDVTPSPALERAVDAVDREWLARKGHAELAFLIGERRGDAEALRRLFVARQEGQVVGYLSCSPAYGRRSGWLYDLSRRRATVPPGVAELLTATAIERFRAEGVDWLHFGLTPFADITAEHEVEGGSSPAVAWAVRQLVRHGDRLYPARDQSAYKRKWQPQLVQPEYVAFSGHPTVRAVWQLLRLTRVV